MTIISLIIFLGFLYIEPVLSTSNNSLIFGYSIHGENDFSKYKPSLYHLLGSLSSKTTITRFSNFTTSSLKTPNQLHGIYLCHGDVDSQTCQSCINTARKFILRNAPNRKEALVWYNHCMLRYSNESFLGKFDETMWSMKSDNNQIEGNRMKFMNILRRTLRGLAIQASNGRNGNKFYSTFVAIGMAKAEAKSESGAKTKGCLNLHVMAQCTPDLVSSDCFRCLAYANQKILGMSNGSTSARVTYKNCFVQYKTTRMLGDNKVESLPILPSSEITNKTLFRLRVQTIPFSNNSNQNGAITNSTRICFKVRFDIPPFSNKSVNSSSTFPSWTIANSWTVELKELNLDDANSNKRSREWATA